MQMGLREINHHFSRAIRMVRAGREVIVTDRQRPIAVLKPIPRRENEAEIAARLVAEGVLLPGSKTGRMRPIRPFRLRGGPSIDVTLRQERDEK